EQMWEAERGSLEKQLSVAQAELDRARAYWQAEIDKKEQEIKALQVEMQRSEAAQKLSLEQEQKHLEAQIAPWEAERVSRAHALEEIRLNYATDVQALEKQQTETETHVHQLSDQAKKEAAEQEARFRQARA